MKLLDYLIIAAVVGCMLIGYAGHRVVAILLFLLVVILAMWRYHDWEAGDSLGDPGCSGELNPNRDNWADLRAGDDGASDDFPSDHGH